MTVAAPAPTSASATGGPIRVLFVCTGNSARSLFAEALLRHIGGDRFDVRSAGTYPKGVNPLTLRTLEEAGIPTERLSSKQVDEFVGQPFDYVITVCDQAREACPVFPGVENALHWGYDDPAAVEGSEEQRRAAFRQVFTAISERIRRFAILAERERREAQALRQAETPPEVAAGLEQRVALLRTIPLFTAMTDRGIRAVAAVAHEETFDVGEALTREGEPGETFLVIIDGRAAVTRVGRSLGEVAGGQFVGEIALVDGGPRTATVTAITPVRALVIDRGEFLELLELSSAVRLGVLEALTQRLRRDQAAGALA